MTCIRCQHKACKRFGTYGRRKIQRWRCQECKATFSTPQPKIGAHYTDPETAAKILTLMLEGMSIRAIERFTGVHRDTILRIMNTAGGWPIQALFWLEWGTTPIFVRLSISFHHIRTVTPITDAIPMPCENHYQIAAAKRVPGTGGGQPLFGIFRCPKQDLTNRSRQN
jgi:hypothetical protein